MTTKLKVGVIGVGGIAGVHMAGWKTSPHTEVVAGCDVNLEALQTWGKRHDVAMLTTHVDALINDPDIDIIDICTPNNYHLP
ncbi:MAG: Gfo/Idh/MocA family oxidoreductase, partial [Armatimonadetes bacterium]|nr:Gfo/Idh/MocA family oxidoreductase [Anaerolineae bacterium]